MEFSCGKKLEHPGITGYSKLARINSLWPLRQLDTQLWYWVVVCSLTGRRDVGQSDLGCTSEMRGTPGV